MYAAIIPQIKAPRSIQAFDYSIPEDLAITPGDIVQVEFRKTKITGLVYELKKTTAFKNIKPIIKKLGDLSLSQEQTKLLDWLEKYYFISPTLAFKTLLPDIPKAKHKVKQNQLIPSGTTISKNRIPDIKQAIKKINKQEQLLFYSNRNEKNAFIIGLLKNLKGQALIIVPELNDMLVIPGLDIGYIHSGLSKNSIYNEWADFKSGKRKIIIGTKKGIFFPTENVELLVIDDEENKSHKNYDQNPRYNVVKVAEEIVKLNPRIKILYTSQAPLIEHYFDLEKIELLRKIDIAKVINMSDEKISGNYSYFSDPLKKELSESKKSFLLFNRKGEFKLYVCRKCGHIIKLDENLTACPKCQSLDLKQAVYGIKKLLSEIQNVFPTKNIIELTKDELPDNIYDADIIIGTDFALNYIDIKNIDLIGVISVDHELAIPEFNASSRVFEKLVRIINLNKKTVIQTHSPLHPAINMAAHLNFKAFYEEEKDIRKKLKYPPYGNLIKIINKKNRQESYIKNPEELKNIKNPDNFIIDRL
ncbi:hypothetical protein KKC88_02820 [Patescibacteria group bacterium]|nr:hypothetical protein [Patescibacteria group bacterium]MBU1672904.1 hypothetical protein [Patescibacteria group bacterium]MBU1963155.1 hypothetical protein [Patescibacteria group bacterium]